MSSEEALLAQSDREEILAYRNQVRAIRRQYWEERVTHGEISRSTRRRLAAAAISYRDALIDYRDEAALNPPWEERELDWIMQYVDQEVEINQESPGRSSANAGETVPAVLEIDHRKIYQLTKSLDHVAKELGFAAPAEPDDRPKGKIEVSE